jgi:hypothetical protein
MLGEIVRYESESKVQGILPSHCALKFFKNFPHYQPLTTDDFVLAIYPHCGISISNAPPSRHDHASRRRPDHPSGAASWR